NGVVGAKVDFFDHEAKDVVELYEAILREGARYHLMFDFHGANKPTGLDRTWPNELTREAIYGFEHRGTAPWGPHNPTVPFTRRPRSAGCGLWRGAKDESGFWRPRTARMRVHCMCRSPFSGAGASRLSWRGTNRRTRRR